MAKKASDKTASAPTKTKKVASKSEVSASTPKKAAPKAKAAPTAAPAVVEVKPEPAPVQVNTDSSSDQYHGSISSIFESVIAQNENNLNNMKEMLTQLKKVYKLYSREIRDFEKNAARERRRAKKDPNRKKREPSGFAVPTSLSKNLCDFLGVSHDTQLSRTDVTRRVTSYIREQNLQVPENRRSFNPDKKLATILGPLKEIDKGKGFTYFNLQRYITPHITSSASASQ